MSRPATIQTAILAIRQKPTLQAAILYAALAQLAMPIGGCRSARQEPKADVELRTRDLESAATQVTDSVQSHFLQVKERTAAGTLSEGVRNTLGNSFADDAKQVEAPAAKGAAARAPAAAARFPRALEHDDAVRFRRLKTAIERANADVERHRPRSR